MESWTRLAMKLHRLQLIRASHAQVFKIGAIRFSNRAPPFVGRDVEVGRGNQIADTAALVRLIDFLPCRLKLDFQQIRLVGYDDGIRHEIEDSSSGTSYGSVELPPRKNGHASRARNFLDNLLGSGDPPSGEPRVNGAQQ